MSEPAVVYVHVAVEPELENVPPVPHVETAAPADPIPATTHNTNTPAIAANNPARRPRAPANNQPNLRTPPKNTRIPPLDAPAATHGRLNNTRPYLTPHGVSQTT